LDGGEAAAAGIMGRRMLRRIGYILGLLFVLACVTAYPLTWGHSVLVSYCGSGEAASEILIRCGHVDLGLYRFVPNPLPQEERGLRLRRGSPTGVYAAYFYNVRFIRESYSSPVHTTHVHRASFPLWMPALAASLFIAWRWRRRRARRQMPGFDVAKAG
jgi:hypothetical protein